MTDETKQEAAPSPLEMSDEDFLNLNGPAEVGAEAPADAATDTETKAEPAAGEGEAAAAETAEASAEAESAGGEAEPEAKAGEEKPEAKAEGEEAADKVEDTPADTGIVVNFEEAYKKIMGPIKANGKTIELRSPEEAVQLMQMGANYTKKMQELQPNLKIVTMLGNHGLLDQDKLSFLIDLEKGDPEAIKKFVKDKGIDVLDIDTSVEPAYQPGGHTVSDQEVSFRSATAELVSTPEGRETISEINSRWDEASKEALWDQPEIMATIHEQRSNGVYDTITTEMDRLITLGQMPANTPFLKAYKFVGDALVAAQAEQAGGDQPGQTQEVTGSGPQLLATKAAAPKSPLANDDKAKAASPTRTGAKKAEVFKNPLSVSDADFLKSMEGRV